MPESKSKSYKKTNLHRIITILDNTMPCFVYIKRTISKSLKYIYLSTMKLFMSNSHRQVKNGIKVKISIKYTNLKTIKKLL